MYFNVCFVLSQVVFVCSFFSEGLFFLKHCSFLLLSLPGFAFQSCPPVWKCETSNQHFGSYCKQHSMARKVFLECWHTLQFNTSGLTAPRECVLAWRWQETAVVNFPVYKGSTWLKDGSSTAAIWSPKHFPTGINANLNHHPDLHEPPVPASGPSIS